MRDDNSADDHASSDEIRKEIKKADTVRGKR